MSASSSPFQTHLAFFATPTHPRTITFTSALKANLSLGFNFPVSCIMASGLRIMYSPSWLGLSRPRIGTLPPSQHLTQLETVKLPKDKSSFSKDELLAMIPEDKRTFMNRRHVSGLWTLAADNATGRVRREDVEEFQRGSLLKTVAARRRKGRGDDVVLPFLRGGPGSVAGHSWVVWKLFGVRVYEK